MSGMTLSTSCISAGESGSVLLNNVGYPLNRSSTSLLKLRKSSLNAHYYIVLLQSAMIAINQSAIVMKKSNVNRHEGRAWFLKMLEKNQEAEVTLVNYSNPFAVLITTLH